MRYSGKDVEPLRSPGYRIGDQAPGNAGERNSVTGEALKKVYAGCEATKVRRTVHRDVHNAPPAVVDSSFRELREYLEHPRTR